MTRLVRYDLPEPTFPVSQNTAWTPGSFPFHAVKLGLVMNHSQEPKARVLFNVEKLSSEITDMPVNLSSCSYSCILECEEEVEAFICQ